MQQLMFVLHGFSTQHQKPYANFLQKTTHLLCLGFLGASLKFPLTLSLALTTTWVQMVDYALGSDDGLAWLVQQHWYRITWGLLGAM